MIYEEVATQFVSDRFGVPQHVVSVIWQVIERRSGLADAVDSMAGQNVALDSDGLGVGAPGQSEVHSVVRAFLRVQRLLNDRSPEDLPKLLAEICVDQGVPAALVPAFVELLVRFRSEARQGTD